MTTTPFERLRENAVGLTSTVVTGIWLAAMVAGYDWWLPALLFGYVVIVPVVSVLFGDEDDVEEWVSDRTDETQAVADRGTDAATASTGRDALETLRNRYARGELTDEQFERKLERLLETESLEDVEERARERIRE